MIVHADHKLRSLDDDLVVEPGTELHRANLGLVVRVVQRAALDIELDVTVAVKQLDERVGVALIRMDLPDDDLLGSRQLGDPAGGIQDVTPREFPVS